MLTFLDFMDLKSIPIREFGKKYAKHLHEAPLIITKAGKPAFVVLTHDVFLTNFARHVQSNEPPKPLDFIPEPAIVTIAGKPTALARLKKILSTKLF